MSFLLIAYKPNSHDYCRGCHMASYSSDHEVHNNLDADRLVALLSLYLERNLNLDCNEKGYGFWIFKDGIKVWEDNYSTWDGYDRWEYLENYNELDAQQQADEIEINVFYKQAEALAKTSDAAKKAEEKQKKFKEAKEAAEKAKADRLREFEKLKKEFEC